MSKEEKMTIFGAPAEEKPSRSGGPLQSSGVSSWKLYDNPFYNLPHHHGGHLHRHHHHPGFATRHPYFNHPARLPVSARKLAASLWDVATALHHPMDSGSGGGGCGASTPDLHLARDRIRELKAELDFERRLRKKAEALSRALAREAAEERARREGLAVELARVREEAGELRREVEEERRMMRVAEAMREERVQMKLAEARLLMEEKLLEMRGCSPGAAEAGGSSRAKAIPAMGGLVPCAGCAAEDGGGGAAADGESGGGGIQQRREAENPHIRRGIKGFVEFPRVGRARAGWVAGPREGKGDPGPKLECQMAQLRVLLKHRVPVGLSSSGSVNLVM